MQWETKATTGYGLSTYPFTHLDIVFARIFQDTMATYAYSLGRQTKRPTDHVRVRLVGGKDVLSLCNKMTTKKGTLALSPTDRCRASTAYCISKCSAI